MQSFSEKSLSLFPNGDLRFYSLARHAFVDALRLAKIQSSDRVLVPSYICRDVLASIQKIGAVPCWYDVDQKLAPALDPSNWPEAKAVLAVNYFGFPQSLKPFEEYQNRTGAKIIEDNAHGLLSRDVAGRHLGCRTEIGIFSLRKTLRIADGAALWVRKSNEVQSLPDQLPFNGFGMHQAQLVKSKLRRLKPSGDKLFRASTSLVRSIRKYRTGSETPNSDPESERRIPEPSNPWRGLLPALAQVDERGEIIRRRKAYQQAETTGAEIGATPVFGILPKNCAPYGYAFRGNASAIAGMQRFADSHYYDLVTWPDLPTEVSQQAYAHYHNIYLVNFLW